MPKTWNIRENSELWWTLSDFFSKGKREGRDEFFRAIVICQLLRQNRNNIKSLSSKHLKNYIGDKYHQLIKLLINVGFIEYADNVNKFKWNKHYTKFRIINYFETNSRQRLNLRWRYKFDNYNNAINRFFSEKETEDLNENEHIQIHSANIKRFLMNHNSEQIKVMINSLNHAKKTPIDIISESTNSLDIHQKNRKKKKEYYIYLLNSLMNPDFSIKKSPTCDRLFFFWQSLPRELRLKLSYINDGGIVVDDDLVEIDISNSHPLILSKILNNNTSQEYNFFKKLTEEGSFYEFFKNLIIDNPSILLKYYHKNKLINAKFTNSDYYNIIEIYKKYGIGLIKNLMFDTLLYSKKSRSYVYESKFKKGDITYHKPKALTNLSEVNKVRRIFIDAFRLKFPTLFLQIIKLNVNNKEFAYYIMQEESYLVTNIISKKIQEKANNPFFTIHDSIVCSRVDAALVKSCIKEVYASHGIDKLQIKIKNK